MPREKIGSSAPAPLASASPERSVPRRVDELLRIAARQIVEIDGESIRRGIAIGPELEVLHAAHRFLVADPAPGGGSEGAVGPDLHDAVLAALHPEDQKIGRASCRERVGRYGKI